MPTSLTWTRELLPQMLELRYSQLRIGLPRGSERYPGVDDDPRTRHLLAEDSTNHRLVGCATLQCDPRGDLKYRIRAMAVSGECQGRGIGAAMLAEIQRVAHEEGTGLWCNARLRAVTLYERAGFVIVSDRYELPGIGPHHDMEWRPPSE